MQRYGWATDRCRHQGTYVASGHEVLPEGVGRIDVVFLAHEGKESHRSCSVGRCKRFCGISKLILGAISAQSPVSVSSLRLMLSANDGRSPLLSMGLTPCLVFFDQ